MDLLLHLSDFNRRRGCDWGIRRAQERRTADLNPFQHMSQHALFQRFNVDGNVGKFRHFLFFAYSVRSEGTLQPSMRCPIYRAFALSPSITRPHWKPAPAFYPESIEEAVDSSRLRAREFEVKPTFLYYLRLSRGSKVLGFISSKSVAHAKHASGSHASNSENL
jgi:hypothetical protein